MSILSQLFWTVRRTCTDWNLWMSLRMYPKQSSSKPAASFTSSRATIRLTCLMISPLMWIISSLLSFLISRSKRKKIWPQVLTTWVARSTISHRMFNWTAGHRCQKNLSHSIWSLLSRPNKVKQRFNFRLNRNNWSLIRQFKTTIDLWTFWMST